MERVAGVSSRLKFRDRALGADRPAAIANGVVIARIELLPRVPVVERHIRSRSPDRDPQVPDLGDSGTISAQAGTGGPRLASIVCERDRSRGFGRLVVVAADRDPQTTREGQGKNSR